MKAKTFEEYLQNLHGEQYIGIDDDMPDNFEYWLSQFGVAEILELVAKYEADKNIAGATLGSIKTDKKAQSSRTNGKLGGRPKNA